MTLAPFHTVVGEVGVGKTAVVEGLVQYIQSGQGPESMKDKRVFALDLAALKAGARVRGNLEDRIKGIFNDIESTGGETILFLDDLHIMVNAEKSEVIMEMSYMLKPALARGVLQLIGATSLHEYRIIAHDEVLSRGLHPVIVKKPNVTETLSILRGLKSVYELHHGVRIKEEALVAASILSDEYLQVKISRTRLCRLSVALVLTNPLFLQYFLMSDLANNLGSRLTW